METKKAHTKIWKICKASTAKPEPVIKAKKKHGERTGLPNTAVFCTLLHSAMPVDSVKYEHARKNPVNQHYFFFILLSFPIYQTQTGYFTF